MALQMPQALNPLLQHAMMAQTGLPIGRRANGFGASPRGPGGPIPAHQLNFLGGGGGMAGAGMLGSPFSAGRYPFPQQPMPIDPMMMGGGGMMGGQGMMNPMIMAYLQQLYLEMLFSQQEDADDTGVWDGEDEEGADVLAKLRRRRGVGGRRGGLGAMGAGMGGGMGMGMGMSPFGMAPMGIM